MTILSTPRLVLRIFNVDDAEFVFELMNDPSWIRYIGDKGIHDLDKARAWILERPLESQRQHGFSFYVVTLKDTQTPVGICGLIKRATLQDVDMGYAFLPQFCGQGYAYEAAQAVMQYAQQEFAFKKLAAITSPDNQPSNQLLRKLGFTLEQVLVMDGEEQETNLYAYHFPV